MNADDWLIAVLYNVENGHLPWGEPHDLLARRSTTDVASLLCDTLKSLGYRAFLLGIPGSLEVLRQELAKLSPTNTFIYNLCDSFDSERTAQAVVCRELDRLGFRYTGSTGDTIAACTNKAQAKERLRSAGLPTPAYRVYESLSSEDGLPYPVIVKPLYEDGSQGISEKSVASNPAEMLKQVEYVLRIYKQPALVEEFIPGRELAVSLWGNGEVEALPVVEHDYSHVADPLKHVLTFDVKWYSEQYYGLGIEYRCPADLPAEIARQVKDTAAAAYRAIGLRDLGRIDIRYHNDTPYIIDINEIPELQPEAGFVLSAGAAGLTYVDVVQKVLGYAMAREGLLDSIDSIGSIDSIHTVRT